jgi:hypothetical protein
VLARVPIGLAVKNGAPHPDISSVEAFKRTLLDARSIAYVDPASGGTSGIFLAQALEKLGIAAELKSKIRLVSPAVGQSSPRVGEVVQRGEVEIGIQPISELMEVPGIDIVGPLPADLQSPDLVYISGSPAASGRPLPAKALIDFLAASSAAPVYKANGMEPGQSPTTRVRAEGFEPRCTGSTKLFRASGFRLLASSALTPACTVRRGTARKWDREFESGFLQRRVTREPVARQSG